MNRIHIALGMCVFVLLGTPGATVRAQDAPRALTLDDCLSTGLAQQPALAAAQSSLNAAILGQQGVDNLPLFASIFSRDVKIRRQQAAIGVNIASAGVDVAEWETRYAITRNFFSVMYAHAQLKVLDSALAKLRASRKTAQGLVDAGDPKVVVTAIDVKNLDYQIEISSARRVEAEVGMKRAFAALREAMGVDCHFPLDLLETLLPEPVDGFTCKEVVELARTRRGELAQAAGAVDVTGLEITAQRRLWCKLSAKTYAAGGDIHAKQVPQGVANHEYRPGGLLPEMPPFLIGKHTDRADRASAFYGRAGDVLAKSEILVTLDAEAAFTKWEEAYRRIAHFTAARKLALEVNIDTTKRFDTGKVKGDELIRAQTNEEQALALYNDALYLHALALANLERVTAGGLRPTYAGKE
jgi:outer membrane protein TolC